ncbi:MAG: hypothetical protein ABJF11_20305 [Reichenbachiella sp.]|uniref:hypothetical protein n=1 Tax=Reichenbachiella sp. TaxID=2184521 RepID=UPI003267F55B
MNCGHVWTNFKLRILANGMYFTGGGSNYSSLCEQISKEANLNYELSQTPFHDNINGLKSIIDNPEQFKMYLMQ